MTPESPIQSYSKPAVSLAMWLGGDDKKNKNVSSCVCALEVVITRERIE